jgi:UDP-glucose 4-epimerase
MRILVTGGAGFIGSNIVDAYIEEGHQVWVLDDESSGDKGQVHPKARYIRLNICDRLRVLRFFKGKRFDIVNHHAAQIDVRRSVADPLYDAKVNILGLLNILEECRHANVKKIIFSSSGGTVYGECPTPADESSPEVPLSPYGVAKLASEKYILAFSSLYGLSYTIFRYANVYGPRQDPHGEAGVVAIFSNRLLSGDPVYIYGSGKQTRDFVFVGDVARANVMALKKGKNEIINIGTGKETSVKELFQTMASATGLSSPMLYKAARAGELKRSVLDITKARRVLGWTPETNLKTGLKRTIDYFAVHSQ